MFGVVAADSWLPVLRGEIANLFAWSIAVLRTVLPSIVTGSYDADLCFCESGN